jgi:Mce-associated membrane protein
VTTPDEVRFRKDRLTNLAAFVVIPAISLLLAVGAGFLRWEYSSRTDAQEARVQSVQAARESTAVVLTYHAATVEKDFDTARSRLTGAFLDAYTQLANTVIIPGAKEKQMSAAAQIPAAASVSATANHAVVLVFVNQTMWMGTQAPTMTPSSVRVTMDKVDDRWLISGFDPV